MELREMKYILAIAQYGNLTKASEKLFVTQPTLTKFLQNQERIMGVSLFQKSGKRYILTYAGERFVQHATQILRSSQELESEMNAICGNHIGRVNVGFPVMRVAHILPLALPAFRELYPNVEINVSLASSSMLCEKLMSGEIDISFFLKPEKQNGLTYETLYEEEFLLAVPPDHRVVDIATEIVGHRYPWVDLRMLKEEPFILQVPGQRSRQIADSLFAQMDFEPNICLEIENIGACLGLIAAGYCCGFVTESLMSASFGIQRPPQFFSIGSPKYSIPFVAAFRKGAKLNRYAQAFVDAVRRATMYGES